MHKGNVLELVSEGARFFSFSVIVKNRVVFVIGVVCLISDRDSFGCGIVLDVFLFCSDLGYTLIRCCFMIVQFGCEVI